MFNFCELFAGLGEGVFIFHALVNMCCNDRGFEDLDLKVGSLYC